MDSQFADLIVTCCKLREPELRSSIKKVLIEQNFSIQEDCYQSKRLGEFSNISNLLAIRQSPKICLVSHTDVCRDHETIKRQYSIITAPIDRVNPTIKKLIHLERLVNVIQDKDCLVQVGGDDRVGVAIELWLAMKTDLPMALLFTTDEEIGLLSARQVEFPELMDFELLVQIDRGNQPNQQIVTKVAGIQLCEESLANFLVCLSRKQGISRQKVTGYGTDVVAIKARDKCKNAINLTCGYHNSFGHHPSEYIVIHEAEETVEYVKDILEFFSSSNKS